MKKYIVDEFELLELLEAYITLSILNRDGVDNWMWYMESEREVVREYFSEMTEEEFNERKDNGLGVSDCAELCLEDYTKWEGEENV